MKPMLRACLLASLAIANTACAEMHESVCYGKTHKGKITGAVQLPVQGKNFIAYSDYGVKHGRTYVHSKVKDVVLESFKLLETDQPGKKFKYAEIGFKNGGAFAPHKTHQNGLSVDFMVPVVNNKGESVYFPSNDVNTKLGYETEFDANGKSEHYQIDFEALAAQIVAIDKAAKNQGVKVWRFIFDPTLRKQLYKTPYGPYIKKHITFLKNSSWVRHDEHFHVDFDIPCRRLL